MLIGFFIVVIGAGVIYTFVTRGKVLGVSFFQGHAPTAKVAGASTSSTPVPTAKVSPSPTAAQHPLVNSEQNKPTSIITYPTVTLTPTPNTNNQTNSGSASSFDLSSFKYPNSLITAKTETVMDLESTDDPNTISNWYQNQMSNIGFHTTSVVTTNSNGNVLDKLAGSNNNSDVKITISKNAGSDPTVKIQVEL